MCYQQLICAEMQRGMDDRSGLKADDLKRSFSEELGRQETPGPKKTCGQSLNPILEKQCLQGESERSLPRDGWMDRVDRHARVAPNRRVRRA